MRKPETIGSFGLGPQEAGSKAIPGSVEFEAMNKNLPTVILGSLLLIVLVLYMVFFQVRFTEAAVVTTFGQPKKPLTAPGLYKKWPWPIQKVVKYDKRVRIFEDVEEQTLTRDSKNLIVVTYCGWHVENPLNFLQSVGTVDQAETRLREVIRSHKTSVVGRYNLSNFVSTDPAEIKFKQIEAEIKEPVADSVATFGMGIDTLGIKRLSLPRSVTESVFDRMKKTREKIAAEYEEQGKAIAAQIVTNAEQMANRIKSFAENRARSIETEGQAKAAKMFSKFEESPELAEFLLELRYLPKMFEKETVIYIDPSIDPSVELLSGPQSVSKRWKAAAKPGESPGDGEAKTDEKKVDPAVIGTP